MFYEPFLRAGAALAAVGVAENEAGLCPAETSVLGGGSGHAAQASTPAVSSLCHEGPERPVRRLCRTSGLMWSLFILFFNNPLNM